MAPGSLGRDKGHDAKSLLSLRWKCSFALPLEKTSIESGASFASRLEVYQSYCQDESGKCEKMGKMIQYSSICGREERREE